jgi:Uma2 family endonuclease
VVRVAPYDVRLFPGTIRQPEVLFIREEHRDRIQRTLNGPPDWVAEVISPEERETDEVVKMAEYARAGVPEYWLLDPEAETIRVYNLAGDSYALAATAAAGQVARAVTLDGFEVAADTIFGG